MARHDGNQIRPAEADKQDERLVTDLLDRMHSNGADYTNTFRDLGRQVLPRESTLPKRNLRDLASSLAGTTWWGGTKFDSSAIPLALVNLVVIPRNHKVEEALQAGEEGNLNPFRNLLKALRVPTKKRIIWRPTKFLRNHPRKSTKPSAEPE